VDVREKEGDLAGSRSENWLWTRLLGRAGVEKLGLGRNGLVVARECIFLYIGIWSYKRGIWGKGGVGTVSTGFSLLWEEKSRNIGEIEELGL